MSNLYCSESTVWIDGERRSHCGETGPYETFTPDLGELYRACRKTWGRCIGAVYVDSALGEPKRVGWVFLKRNPEGDGLLETWITVWTAPRRRVPARWEGGQFAAMQKGADK